MSDRISELLEEHNRLAVMPLKEWKGTEGGLEKRVEMLRRRAPASTGGKPAEAEKRATIGSVIVDELKAGNTNTEDILKKVRKQFPEAGTNANSVRWYASQNKISLRPPKAGDKPAKKGAAKKGAAKKGAAKKGAKSKPKK